MFKLGVVALVMVVGLAHSAPTIDNSLLRNLRLKGTTNIVISMSHGTTKEALEKAQIEQRSFPNRGARINAVAGVLKAQADAVQSEILAHLRQQRFASSDVRQLWISNQIIVRQANLELVESLLGRSDVSKIEEEWFIQLEQSEVIPVSPKAGEQWGVAKIQAPAVWAAENGTRGEGVVVANIDTGVRGGHEALVNNFREEYGWYDPAGHTPTHADFGGHGTHTMGTIVGQTRGIGVAPGAQWVACKGCGTSQCANTDLLECGQWTLCPTDTDGTAESADCSKAPQVVSNSWGGGAEDPFYDSVIKAWRGANIIPVFAMGNAGPTCGTANSPGDSTEVIGVGSTNDQDHVSSFSSVGPTAVTHRMKPDVSAPGTSITSASNLGPAQYVAMSGTSMACPHTAGLVALLLSKNPNLTFAQVKNLLEQGCDHTTPGVRNCGGVSESVWPNHHVGWGRLNAVKSVNSVPAF